MRTLALLAFVLSCSTALAQSAPTDAPPATDSASPTTAAPATTDAPAAADGMTAAPAATTAAPPMQSPSWDQASPKTANVRPQAEQPIPATLPLAGYTNGGFFLRDPHDWFVLYPRGRLQIDWYNFLNRGDAPAGVVPNSNGSKDPRPKDTIFVRRARVEVQGTFLGHWDFHIAGEFTTTPGAGSLGILADAYIIADYLVPEDPGRAVRRPLHHGEPHIG